MSADPRRVKDLFAAAVDVADPRERLALLDRECGGEADLRRRVDVLLAAHDRPDAVVDRPLAGGTIDDPADVVGTLVAGRYKLLEEIGEGGMGTVWMAEQREPVKRLVALKLIKPGMDSRAVLARFEAERQALAVMDHPNIARVLDGGTTEQGRPFFVMELVKGLPLTAYCDDRRLSVRDRLDLFVQVCSAVQHAHQKGIIHRDLKPSNVLVTEHDGKPVPKVIDFGLAKALQGSQVLTEKTLHTSFGAVVGTPLYMAPEQVGINALDVDTRSDIYALGVILYELLTGTTPLEKKRFADAAWDEMRRLIREEDPPRPSLRLSTSDALPSLAATRQTEPAKLSRSVRGELDWIVMKALEKDRNRRYETASGFAADVGRHLAGEPVQAVPPSVGYRLRKFCRRNAAAITITAAIFVTLKAVTLFSIWQVGRAQVAETIAATERDEAERQRDRATEAEWLARQRLGEVTAEKKRADEERAVAQAVSDFLQKDLLAQAGPSDRPDPDLKLRAVLDRAAERVAGRFAHQPHVEAGLRATIGLAYSGLGLKTEALPHLERAAELYRQIAAVKISDPRYLTSRLALQRICASLSGIYYGRGELDKMRRARDASVELVRELLREVPPGTRRDEIYQAIQANNATIVAELIPGRMAMTDAEAKRLDRVNADTILLKANGQTAEAIRLLKNEIASARAQGGSQKLLMALQMSLARMYLGQADYATAERELAELIRAARAGGDALAELPDIYIALASCRAGQKRLSEAEAAIREALALRLRTTDPHSLTLVNTLMLLAMIEEEQHKYSAAEQPIRQALAILDRQMPNGELRFIAMVELGENLVNQHKLADAEPLLRQGRAGLLKAPGAPTAAAYRRDVLLKGARGLARLCEATGRPVEAATMWNEVWSLADAPATK